MRGATPSPTPSLKLVDNLVCHRNGDLAIVIIGGSSVYCLGKSGDNNFAISTYSSSYNEDQVIKRFEGAPSNFTYEEFEFTWIFERESFTSVPVIV